MKYATHLFDQSIRQGAKAGAAAAGHSNGEALCSYAADRLNREIARHKAFEAAYESALAIKTEFENEAANWASSKPHPEGHQHRRGNGTFSQTMDTANYSRAS